MVAPLAVTSVMLEVVTTVWTPLGFLNPNVLVGTRPAGVFLASSPLLRPASEEECWMMLEEGDIRPFSETLASSVLPIGKKNGAAGRLDYAQNLQIMSTLCVY